MRHGVIEPKGVVVIGGHINGLGIIRSFRAQRIPVAVILTKRHDFAQYSRCISGYDRAFGIAEDPQQLSEVLDRRSSQWGGWALFPANDEALAALVHNRQHLECSHAIFAPPAEIASYFLDKERMLNIAGSTGIPMPLCYGPADKSALHRQDIRFPVIVKPVIGYLFFEHFGFKVMVAENREELAQAISRIERAGIRCQIYDIIPGSDSRIYCCCVYMGRDGTPQAILTVRKLRQSPPFFGVARVAEIVPDNACMAEATVELLRRINFRGIASAEYKLDPRDETFRFLEVNGRSVIYNPLLRKAGMDVAGLTWADYIEGRTYKAKPRHWPGIWINLHADLLYSMLRRHKEKLSLRDFLTPYLRPKVEAVWAARDPLPFLIQWTRTFRRAIGMMAG
jgi:predicted ATP-grasp superfamily ATP-dependent carboligase